MTKRIYQSGELLGIRLVDHVIIGDRRYCSMREQKLLPEAWKEKDSR